MPVLPPELEQAYEDRNLIVVVGSGLSRAVGLPSDAELAEALIELADRRRLPTDLPRLRRRLSQGRVAEVLGVLERRFGAEFPRQVERRLSDQGAQVPELAVRIAALRPKLRAIYTTSLDRLMERALADQWPSIALPRADLAQRRGLVFKLRGTLELRQSWVLTREREEQEFAGRSLRRAIFDAAYRAHQMLFVGFEAESEVLDTLLGMVAPGAGASELPGHFIALDDCAPEVRNELERRGLEPLRSSPEQVVQALGEGADASVARGPAEICGCPYPGLQAFSEADVTLFFGRQAEVGQAVSRLGGLGDDHRRWLAIEGPSGVGKSSFARAGVVPALRRGFGFAMPARWLVVTMRPGLEPMAKLVRALHDQLELPNPPELALRELEGVEPQEGAERLARSLDGRSPGRGVLIVVDQLEELVTLSESGERLRFSLALAKLLEGGLIYLVTTLRTDFLPSCQVAAPALAGLLNEKAERYALTPISRVGLREAIIAPAELAGVELEPAMVERLVLDAEEMGQVRGDEGQGKALTRAGTLPLVAHVLRGLWEVGARDGRVIGLREYEAIGGLAGALSRSADGLLATLDGAAQARAKALLLAMVRVSDVEGETRRTLSREAAVVLAGEDVLLALSGATGAEGPSARVLVVHHEGEQAWVDLVHEALLRGWSTLVRWINEDRGQLVLDAELERQAERWDKRGRPRLGLPWGQELAGLLQARPRGTGEMLQRRYQRTLRRMSLLRRGIGAGLAGLVTVTSVVVASALASRNAKISRQERELLERNRELAAKEHAQRRALSVQRGLRAATAIAEARDLDALILGVQAVGAYDPSWTEAPPPDAVTGLELALALGALVVEDSEQLSGHEGDIPYAAYAPDGARVVTTSFDGSARIWDPQDGRLVAKLEGHEGYVIQACFLAEGRIATSSKDGSARIWNEDGSPRFVLQDPEGKISRVACSPDGIQVATAGKGSRVRVWDSAGGAQQFALAAEPDTNYALAYSPDGDRIAAGAEDGRVRLFDARRGTLEHTLIGHEATVYALAFSPDGSRLATGSFDFTARLWDVDGGPSLAVLRGHEGWVYALAYAPDGSTLATASPDGTARVWSADTGASLHELRGHSDRVRAVAYSPDGALLATGSSDTSARLWDPSTGRHLASLRGHTKAVYAVDFSPSGAQILSASLDGDARVWSAAIDRDVAMSPGHDAEIFRVAFSPDGQRLASAGLDGAVILWEVASGKPFLGLERHDEQVWRVGFSPDGRTLLSSSSDGVLRLWDPNTGELRRQLRGARTEAYEFCYSPRGDRVASGSKDGKARIWALDGEPDLEGGLTPLLTLEGHDKAVLGVSYSSDGALIATSSSDTSARIWDAVTGEQITALVGHGDYVTGLAFAPGASAQRWRLVTASQDGDLRLWSSGQNDAERVIAAGIGEIGSLNYSPEGDRIVAAGSSGLAKIFDATTGEVLASFEGHEGEIYSAVLSSDGRRLATASKDGTGRLWNARSGELIAVLDGHVGEVNDIVFSPRGDRLATAGQDHRARIWDGVTGAPLHVLERHVGRVQADGSIAWPVAPRELTEIGCRQLRRDPGRYAEVAAICGPLLGGGGQ